MSGWGTIYNNTSSALHKHGTHMARLQEMISSGSRVSRPSDDPNDANIILQMKSTHANLQSYTRNLDEVSRSLEASNDTVLQVTRDLATINQRLTQAASGTLSDAQRQAMAAEADSILESVLRQINTPVIGQYLFSGAATNVKPLQVTRENGEIVDVKYGGSDIDMKVMVAPGIQFSKTSIAPDIFQDRNPGDMVFHGNTGVVEGTGTSSVQGTTRLDLEHVETLISDPGASGVAVGTSSAAGDTILGVHSLQINTDTKQVSLDGGSAVAYDGTETDLAVKNADGDVVHLDMTGVVASAGTKTVELTGNGQASIDGGASWSTIDTFGDNVVVANASTGRALYLDTTDLQRTGTERIRRPGTYNLCEALMEVRDTLRNKDKLPESEQTKMLAAVLESVDEVRSLATQELTGLGGRLQALDGLRTSLQDQADRADIQRAEMQDADVVQVATDLARYQTLYEMTLASASKLLSISLLDFIR
ncbi:MAG: flagellar hook-associated protein FlgL [Phycisphaerae bacterium]